MIGWNLILAIIMAFWPTRGDPNRLSALVALWNSGESMSATTVMVSYCKKVILYMLGGKPKEASTDSEGKGLQSRPVVTGQCPKTDPNDIGFTNESAPLSQDKHKGTRETYFDSDPKCGVSNLLWGILFVFIALAMTIGNVLAGILVPVQLSIGNVAPVAKDAIFYPVMKYDTESEFSKINSLQVSPALRALAATEGLADAVRKRVNLNMKMAGGSVLLNYDYKVTGRDMGLLSDPKLYLEVQGACRTDDTWLLSSTDNGDTYQPFGENETFEIKRQPDVYLPPTVNFLVPTEMEESCNVSYAMIVNTAGLYSHTSSQDPWYITDKARENGPAQHQVRGGRPALSCWEAKRWHLNREDVDCLNLNTLPGLKLHKLWAEDVFPLEFRLPRVAYVGWIVGSAALKSASYTQGPNFTLDAGASNIHDDLERLVFASWLSTQNFLRDTTTYKRGDLENLAEGPGGSVEAGSAQFILQSQDVDTLSVRILVAVPAILLSLFIVKIILACVLRDSRFRQDPIIPGEKENRVALLATQLYRGLDEKISSRNWKHTESLIPFVYPQESGDQLSKTDHNEKTGGAVTPGASNAGHK